MSRRVRALALDYDGTLTVGERPEAEVLDGLRRLRDSGCRAVLVTGRIFGELERIFPDVTQHFDAIVTENGAFVLDAHGRRPLGASLPDELLHELGYAGVPARKGSVLVACQSRHDQVALAAIHRLGLDAQLVYNRNELMILPAGVTKGSGVRAALADLGVSRFNAVAVGDAENDLALFEAVEVGVAVANAVGTVRAHADLVLEFPAGRGVLALIDALLDDESLVLARGRRSVVIGTTSDGVPVHLNSLGGDVIIAGGSASGKSYLGGVVAERLIRSGHVVVVLDAEGDHGGLASLPNVSVVEVGDARSARDELLRTVVHHEGSVVVDLSQLGEQAKAEFHESASYALAEACREHGLPHWLVIDEAHQSVREGGWSFARFCDAGFGHCLITYRPSELADDVVATTDVVLLLPHADLGEHDPAVELYARFASLSRADAASRLATTPPGAAVMVSRANPGIVTTFAIGERSTPHIRHWHKYATASLPIERHFFFRASESGPTYATAGNLTEFHHQLRSCPDNVMDFHLLRGDFSRWLKEVFADDRLADDLHAVEVGYRVDQVGLASTRDGLLTAIERRYPPA